MFAGGTVSGSQVLNAVEIRGTVTIAGGTVLTVPGSLTLTAGALNTGTLEAQGPITQTSGFSGASSGTLLIDGTADQTFTGTATPAAGDLPVVVIAKPSGTLTLAGTIRTTHSWTYTTGTLAVAGSTLVFAGGTVTGSHVLNAVEIGGPSRSPAGRS